MHVSLFLHVCLCSMCMAGACVRSQDGVRPPETVIVMNRHVGFGTQMWTR